MLDEQFTASTNAETFLDLDLLPAFKKELKPRKVVGSKRGQGGIALFPSENSRPSFSWKSTKSLSSASASDGPRTSFHGAISMRLCLEARHSW